MSSIIKGIALFCTFIASNTILIQLSFADITEKRTPTGIQDGIQDGIQTVTKVYFEYNGEPYNKPVMFTIDCFGYKLSKRLEKTPPENYKSGKIFSFEGTYPDTDTISLLFLKRDCMLITVS